MDNFEASLTKSNRLINSSLIIGITLLGVGFVVSVGLYLHIFSGGLSHQSADWSALGSFFGGVFGPIVSVVTLIALLKTLKLQHQTLMSQKSDSERVIGLQNQSYQSQAQQLLIAEEELKSAKVSDFKNSVIRVFEQRINYYLHSQADALNRIDSLSKLGDFSGTIQAIEEVSKRIELYKVELDRLLRESLRLAVKDFESLEEARAYVASLYAAQS